MTGRARDTIVADLTPAQVAARCLQAGLDGDQDALAAILGMSDRQQLVGAASALTAMLTRNVSRRVLTAVIRTMLGREARPAAVVAALPKPDRGEFSPTPEPAPASPQADGPPLWNEHDPGEFSPTRSRHRTSPRPPR